MTLWIVACQAPLSIKFSRQEYWSGLPFPSPGDLTNPGLKSRSSTRISYRRILLPSDEYNDLGWENGKKTLWVEGTERIKPGWNTMESSSSFIWREGGASKMIRKKMGKEDWEHNEKDFSCHN